MILNLVSLGAAYGIIVFIFQQGHGSEAIWNVHATQSIIAWIPLMIFAFLFGLSMDYEVFMLTRMREAYDETGDTEQAISLGLARTGKLVTSAALVLMFAFFVLSSSPGVDIKQFGIGLAAGIIFDATVIRALLVPVADAPARHWNWWLPAPRSPALLLRLRRPSPTQREPRSAHRLGACAGSAESPRHAARRRPRPARCDVGHAHPSRARLGGNLHRRRRRARGPAARDHRPRRWRPADLERGRHLHRRPER